MSWKNAKRESLIHRWSNKTEVVMIIILYNQIKNVPWVKYRNIYLYISFFLHSILLPSHF